MHLDAAVLVPLEEPRLLDLGASLGEAIILHILQVLEEPVLVIVEQSVCLYVESGTVMARFYLYLP